VRLAVVARHRWYRMLAAALFYSAACASASDRGFSISVVEPNYRYSRAVSHLDKSVVCNLQLIYFESGGKAADRLQLKGCHGEREGRLEHSDVDVTFYYSQSATPPLAIAGFRWESIAGSSSHEDSVQVLTLRAGHIHVLQQISFEVHHGGERAGATFDPKTRVLTVRAVRADPEKGRCCPAVLDVVTYRWSTDRFRETGRTTEPVTQ
jgi:hypothetical protein